MTTRGTPRESGKIRVGDHPIRLANNHFVEREFDWRSYQLGVNPRDPTCKWQERIGDHPNRLAKYHFVEREFDWRSYQLGANPRDPTCSGKIRIGTILILYITTCKWQERRPLQTVS